MIICKICKKECKNSKTLTQHLRYFHKITVREYYDSYFKDEKDGICKTCGKETSFRGLKGYAVFCCIKCYNKNNERRYNISEKYKNRTKEEKENWLTKTQETWKNKSQEEKDRIDHNRKNTCFEKYGDYNYQINQANISLKIKYNVTDNISQNENISKKISNTWQNKTTEEIVERTKKSEKTCLERYNVKHIMENDKYKRKILQKTKETHIERGKWLSDEDISLFELYKRKVRYYTYKGIKEKFTEEDLLKTGLCGIEGALQIDHSFSIKEGFINNIPAHYIGHPGNLQLINWCENDKKKSKSCITTNELFENIWFYDYYTRLDKMEEQAKKEGHGVKD